MSATRSTTVLPRALARLPLRTLRPRDAALVYAQPRGEVRRLERLGALHRLAHGFYVVVPQDQIGGEWMPSLEAAAAGIASAEAGPQHAILMGISAARIHGLIPRALATGVVAIPHQRRPVTLTDRDASIRFVKRDTAVLDAMRVDTDLGSALVTTPEQTILDLARRPSLGDAENEVVPTLRLLFTDADGRRLDELAKAQRGEASLRRARLWVNA